MRNKCRSGAASLGWRNRRLWSKEDIVGLVDDLEVARLTGKRASRLAV
jgi:hypothetical protein